MRLVAGKKSGIEKDVPDLHDKEEKKNEMGFKKTLKKFIYPFYLKAGKFGKEAP